MSKFILFFFFKEQTGFAKYDENDDDVKATHWKPSQISQTLKKIPHNKTSF